MNPRYHHPVLSCCKAQAWEGELLKTEEASWDAMRAVGIKLGRGIMSAYAMTSFPQRGLRALALVGKGHNGGDALLALAELALEEGLLDRVVVALATDLRDLKPNTLRALELLQSRKPVEFLEDASICQLGGAFDLCIDGLLGMQFKPPLRDRIARLISEVNHSQDIRLRVAVDLPSGLGDTSSESPFRADVTFATGIYKRPLLERPEAGIVRYLDIGFFSQDCESETRVVFDSILDPLRGLRPARSEKRRHGHLAILAGSRGMPGALAMCVRSALKSGVGLVTVFAPESVVSQLACTLPEAMWRTWPETPEGGLALEGLWQIKSVLGKASALLLGPGMGAEAETLALMTEVGHVWDKPAVLDADALRPEILDAFAKAETILTPHDGEFARLAGESDCSDSEVVRFAKRKGVTLVKKGSSTRISDGDALYVNSSGNPALSRGGSGDLLAGLMAGLLAQGDCPSLEVACRAVYWHGKAADLLSEECGQVSIRTTDLLDYLVPALRCGV